MKLSSIQIKNLIPWFIFVCGIGCLLLGVKFTLSRRDLRAAVVINRTRTFPKDRSQEPTYQLQIQFPEKGRQKECKVTMNRFFWRRSPVGTELYVLYNPNRDQEKQIYAVREREFLVPYHAVFLGLGLLCFYGSYVASKKIHGAH